MPFSRLSPHTRLMLVAEPNRPARGAIRGARRGVPKTPSILRSRRMALPPLDLNGTIARICKDGLCNSISFSDVAAPLLRRATEWFAQRIGQVLNTWKRRAVETGHIQYIPFPETLCRPHAAMRIVLSPIFRDSSPACSAGVQNLNETPVWHNRRYADKPD